MTETERTAGAKAKRSPLSISLKFFLLVVLAPGVCFGWIGQIIYRVGHQRSVVTALTGMGCDVGYEKKWRIVAAIDQILDG